MDRSVLVTVLAILLVINVVGFAAVILRTNRIEQILHRMRRSNEF